MIYHIMSSIAEGIKNKTITKIIDLYFDEDFLWSHILYKGDIKPTEIYYSSKEIDGEGNESWEKVIKRQIRERFGKK